MLTQRLRHRIDIQEDSIEQDSNSGAIASAWSTIRAADEPLMAAEIVALSGREFIAAQTVQAGITTRITMRWRDGIKASMRAVHQGDVYDIKAVLPDPSLRRWITLMCETGVNNG